MKKLVLTLAALSIIACSTQFKIWKPKQAPQEIPLQGKEIIILPATITIPGDTEQYNKAFTNSILEGLKQHAISIHEIIPTLYSIGFKQTIVRIVDALPLLAFKAEGKNWDNEALESYSDVPDGIDKLKKKIPQLLGMPSLQVDYILTTKINYIEPGTVPHTYTIEIEVVLYSVEDHQVVTAMYWKRQIADDAVLAIMAELGKTTIVDKMSLALQAEKEKEQDQHMSSSDDTATDSNVDAITD